ncbi:uncharacterized protein L199_007451 [Kwoniella botswanensis]|uniref:uncharacterized protein n=1 Tax=Kwoniella botswanensis TaxID=1268659 RepID=UPI00315D014A
MPPHKSTTSAPPLPLPTEILSLVFAYLLDTDRKSLARCCRVSHSIFSIAAPILYRRISISNVLRRDSRVDHSTDRYTAAGKEKTNTRKKKLLRNAEVVTFDDHHATWCGNKTFKYPKLKILVLNLALVGLGSVLHSNDILEKQCSLVKCLEPKKLVLNNMSLINIQTFDMFGVPHKLFGFIEEITLIAPLLPVKPRTIYGGFATMPKLKKLVWIFRTVSPGPRWVPGIHDLLGERQMSKLDRDLQALASFMKGIPVDVPTFIVNSGSMHHRYVGEDTWNERRIQDNFANKLKQAMIAEKLDDWGHRNEANQLGIEERRNIAIGKADSIKILTMKEYLENHDWTGEFDYREAKLWLA